MAIMVILFYPWPPSSRNAPSLWAPRALETRPTSLSGRHPAPVGKSWDCEGMIMVNRQGIIATIIICKGIMGKFLR